MEFLNLPGSIIERIAMVMSATGSAMMSLRSLGHRGVSAHAAEARFAVLRPVLLNAVVMHDHAWLRVMIAQGADPDHPAPRRHNTAAELAVQTWQPDMLRSLLQAYPGLAKKRNPTTWCNLSHYAFSAVSGVDRHIVAEIRALVLQAGAPVHGYTLLDGASPVSQAMGLYMPMYAIKPQKAAKWDQDALVMLLDGGLELGADALITGCDPYTGDVIMENAVTLACRAGEDCVQFIAPHAVRQGLYPNVDAVMRESAKVKQKDKRAEEMQWSEDF